MSAARLACAACAVIALAACAIGKSIPTATTYVVQAPPPSDPQAIAPEAGTLRIGQVRVAAAYSGTALIYRMDDVKFTSDPYNTFIAEPGAMFGDQIAAWLDRAGPFTAVARRDSAQSASYVLEATVTELYGDFRPGRRPAAVLSMQFTLIDMTGSRPKAVLQAAIAKRANLARASPEALVRGYESTLADLLGDLEVQLRRAVAGTSQREGSSTSRIR